MINNIEYIRNENNIEVIIECDTINEMARLRSNIESFAMEELLYIEFKSYNDKDYQSKEFDTIVIKEEKEYFNQIIDDIKDVIELSIEGMNVCDYWEVKNMDLKNNNDDDYFNKDEKIIEYWIGKLY